jgi:hypothetical protein
MATPLRPLSTGELLDKTFSLYRQNFMLFFGIASLPQMVLFAFIIAFGVVSGGALAAGAGRVGANPLIGAGALVVLAFAVCSLIAGAITQAATTFGVAALYLDQPITMASAFSLAKGRMAAVIGVTICFAIALGIGFMLLLIPGFLVLAWYSLAVPASVVENLGVGGAFSRSSKLSKGNGGRILGVYILLVILIIVASLAVQYVIALALVSLKSVPILGVVLSGMSSFVVGALVGPVITIALTLLYFDQRVRKEAFDLEHMMRSLPTGASSAAAAGSTI